MTRVAAIVLVLAALLTGCGDDGPSVVALDDDQAEQALLSEDNLPEGFVVDPDDDDDDSPEPGCLATLDEAEGPEGEAEAEVTYAADDESSLLSIRSFVESHDSVDAAIESMDTGRQALAECEHVDETGENGVRITLDLVMDEESTIAGADEQINFGATGTVSAQGIEIPIVVRSTVVRIDNHLAMVTINDTHEDAESLLQPYLEIAVDRLNAVIDGDEPPATVGPGGGVAA